MPRTTQPGFSPLQHSAPSQEGTAGEDVLWDVAASDDGSFILCGWTDWPLGDSDVTNSDFSAVKLDENGTVVWRWQVIDNRDTDFG